MLNRIAAGIIVIAVGLVLLANTTGNLPWYVWGSVLAYWPVLVIGLGVQILLSKWKVPGLALAVIAMLVLAIVDPLGLAKYPVRHYRFIIPRRILMRPENFQEKAVEVPLTVGLGHLTISGDFPACEFLIKGDPGPDPGGSGFGLRGKVGWLGQEPTVEARTSPPGSPGPGEAVVLEIRGGEGASGGGARYVCDFLVNPSIPAEVTVDSGLLTGDIDNSAATLDRLEIEGGVIDLKVRYGLSGRSQRLSIDGGVVNLEMTVNRDCGLRVRLSGPPLVVKHNFSQAGLVKEGDFWVTPGYSSARTRLEVTVTSGAGNVILHRVSW